jgi:uncharacterized protein YbjT (DUF2867 family)
MTTTVFVTGAAGTTGSELVPMLAAEGFDVRAGVHTQTHATHLDGEGVELVEIDLTDRASLTDAFTGADSLSLLTPFTPDMVGLTQNAVDAAVDAGVEFVVRHSALGADTADVTPTRWHRDAERVVEASGLDYTHLRPTTFMQNLLGQAESIRERGELSASVGDAAISHVDVRDVATVATTVFTEEGHEREAYDLTGPEALTYDDVAGVLSDVTGHVVEYVPVSEEAMRESLDQRGMPDELADAFLELQSWFAEGNGADVASAVVDVTGLPPHSFRQFVADNAETFTPR